MKTYIQQMYKITLEKLKQPAKNTWRLVLFYKHCTSHVISLWKCCAQIQSIYSRFTFLFPQESFNASDFILCFLEFGLKITVVLIQLHQRTHFIWKTKHTYYQQQQQYYINKHKVNPHTHVHMYSFICYSIKSYLLLFYFFLCLTQLQLGCWIYHLNYFCKANKRISRLLSLFLQFLRYLIYIYMYVFVSFVKP